jgi:hypothetical protein
VFQKAEFDADLECIEKMSKNVRQKVLSKEQELCGFSSVILCAKVPGPLTFFKEALLQILQRIRDQHQIINFLILSPLTFPG